MASPQIEQWDAHYAAGKYLMWWPAETLVRAFGRWLAQRAGGPLETTRSAVLRVLDFGCGNGRHVRFVAEHCSRLGVPAQVHGLDISAEAISMAQALVQRAGLGDMCTLAAYGGEQLPFEDGAFDVVVSVAVLDQLPLSGACRLAGELLRVLRPGGSALLDVECVPDRRPLQLPAGERVGPRTVIIGAGCEAGIYQHFFDEGDLQQLLAGWSAWHVAESCRSRLWGPSGESLRDHERRLVVAVA